MFNFFNKIILKKPTDPEKLEIDTEEDFVTAVYERLQDSISSKGSIICDKCGQIALFLE
jgi:hypothetical protein